jgi:hypothetical protein
MDCESPASQVERVRHLEVVAARPVPERLAEVRERVVMRAYDSPEVMGHVAQRLVALGEAL